MRNKMMELNPEHLKSVIDMINKGPFFMHMSMRVTELGIGYSKVVAEIGKKHMNPFGAIHGGVYASVIDTAAYWSAYCDLPEEQGLVTIDLKVDFLSPVLDQKIIVSGKRVKAGKTIYLTEAQMINDNGKVFAHGTSKLLVIHNKQTMNEVVDYVSAERLPSKFVKESHAT
jgi:uncharacterized protein (TIGR00369 family)